MAIRIRKTMKNANHNCKRKVKFQRRENNNHCKSRKNENEFKRSCIFAFLVFCSPDLISNFLVLTMVMSVHCHMNSRKTTRLILYLDEILILIGKLWIFYSPKKHKRSLSQKSYAILIFILHGEKKVMLN